MLDNLFFPKTVAIIGASQKPGTLGYYVMQNNIHLNPVLYPVHPKYKTVLGVKTYTSILDVPEDIDVAISVVGPDNTLKITEECASAHVKFLIIITSRFGEAARFKEGKLLEQKISKISEKSGTRIVGPNCIGVLNLPYINSTFAPAYSLSALKGLPIPPQGNINIISESGSISGLVTAWLVEQGLGLNKLVNYGNGIDLRAADFMEYFKNDEDCTVVGVYTEGIKNGRHFIEACRTLNTEKPLIILKPKSTLASRAAQSHTGSILTNDALFDAALKQVHVQRVRTYPQLRSAVKTHSLLPEDYLKRDHFCCAGITNAGGLKVLLAESLRQNQVPESALSHFSPELVTTLECILPEHVTIANPLDVAGDASSDIYVNVLKTLLEQKNVDCILSIPTFEPGYLCETLVKDTLTLMKTYRKPILVTCTGGKLALLYKEKFQKLHIPTYQTPEDMAFAYQILRKRHQYITGLPSGS